jgi:hypothetical protein
MNLRDGSAPAFVMHLFFISRFMVKETRTHTSNRLPEQAESFILEVSLPEKFWH